MTGISVLAFLPFHQAVETFGTGIEVTRWKTPLVNFVGIHGLFLVVIGAFLVWQARRALYLIAGGNLRLGILDVGMETDSYRRAFQKGLRVYFVAGVGGCPLLGVGGIPYRGGAAGVSDLCRGWRRGT